MRRASLSLLFALLLGGGCRCRPASPSKPNAPPPPIKQGPVVKIPRATSPLTINGEVDEGPWHEEAYVSDAFEDSRGLKAPYSNVRFLADDRNLYIEVYVADGDLHSDGDQVNLVVGPLKLVLHPKNSVVPPGVQLGTDVDGTVDNTSDFDEEWVSEIAIPWELLKSHQVPFRATRIDVGQGAAPHALAWPRDVMATLDFTEGTAHAAR